MHTITVTQEDIDKGVWASCSECPISRAVHRVFPDAKRVTVTPPWIYVDQPANSRDRCTYKMPPEAIRFVLRFDGRLWVEPLSFTVE